MKITGTARDPAISTHAFEQNVLGSSAFWLPRVVARREYVFPPATAFAIAEHPRMDSYIYSLGNPGESTARSFRSRYVGDRLA